MERSSAQFDELCEIVYMYKSSIFPLPTNVLLPGLDSHGKGKRFFHPERSRSVLEPNHHAIEGYRAYLQWPELEVDGLIPFSAK